ncbi:MAG: radical SAM family heme chaperone HemW [Chloroflexi bacterium]|nr:radical SAM family heme chaperone HemW [Chloroflexota bacterium]
MNAPRPLAVYVHIPFCVRVCGYCDFNTYAGMDAVKDAYTAAVVGEIEAWASHIPGREVTSIAFGGGTPGEMPPESLIAIIDAVRAAAPLAPDAEISLEANPGTTSAPALRDLAGAGVNRISFGAQSFHASELAFLDRVHTPEATAASLRLAREAGIPSINLDLMYGLPGQTPADWQATLRHALALVPDHLSLYALTVEPGTPLDGRVERGEVTPLDPDGVAAMYEVASEHLAAAGYRQYELSNWARPGHESRHNRVYWTWGDYLGIGAGAHGFLDGERFENVAHPRAYIDAVRRDGRAIAEAVRPAPATSMSDWLALRLRLAEGFDPAEFAATFGEPLESAAGPPLDACRAADLLDDSGGRLRLTPRGRLLHNEVAVRVMLHLQERAGQSPAPTRGAGPGVA